MGLKDWIFGTAPWAGATKDVVASKPSRRLYEAARPSRIAAGFTNTSAYRSANEILRSDLRGLINHSRQQSENNDYLKSYLSLVRRNVIGPTGVGMQNVAVNQDGSLDKIANDVIETAWDRWGKLGSPTIDGEHSWLSLQNVVAQTVARDGSILVRQFVGRQFGPFGYKLQPLEVDFLDIEMNQDLGNGRCIRMGVELDADGRRAAYHVFTRHPGDYQPGRARDRLRIPAEQMFCIFRPERPGQLLGVPWAYSALRRLNMLRGYEEAAITAARVGAAKMGFYQKTDGTDDVDPDALDGQETTETGHLINEVEPGMLEKLPVGYEFKSHDPQYPNGEMQQFMKVVLQGAAAGLDVSYVTLANDLSGANFSSLRAGKGEEREEWRCLQQWIIEQFHDRVFRNWIGTALLLGQLGRLPPEKADKFTQPRWRPRGWAYVSPGEEANANQREMAAMIRSPQQIVAERGEDLETIFADLQAAKNLAAQYGLEFNPAPPGHEEQQQAPAPEPAAPN
jgi:lambda family phage portal protein